MLIWLERLCLAGGALLLLGLGGNALLADTAAQRAIVALEAKRELRVPPPDTELWSNSRRQASREEDAGTAMAVLRIPALDLVVPVLRGTDAATLNVGAGWMRASAAPGEPGNMAVAAHRDGYFRALKDIRDGDRLTIQSPTHDYTYEVAWTRVVEPDDVYVLAPTGSPVLTLITCYPFYFVGSAPERFIVRAHLKESRPYGRPEPGDGLRDDSRPGEDGPSI